MSEYLPIDSSSLRTDTVVGCDIYLLVKTTAEVRFVLYCKGDAIFEESKKEILVAKKIKSLFVKKEDQQKYFDYLENTFRDIVLLDTEIPLDEKTKIVHSAATNLVKDLFSDPRASNIQRTKTFAYNMVVYILKEGNAAESLLKIAVHGYHTYTHSVNVAAVGTLFAKNIGLGENDLKQLCSGILLHDLGKTKISTDILNKKGKLTKEEFQIIKTHPVLGAAILKETGRDLKDECIITLQHHENFDGTGYPYGLKKDEIHPSGKIARIIDVYDALTTNRPYAEAVRPFNALKEMKEKMLNCFDKEMFVEFIRFLGSHDPRGKPPRKKDKIYN